MVKTNYHKYCLASLRKLTWISSPVGFSISWIRGTAAGSPQRWSSSAEIPKRARVNEKPLVMHPNIWNKKRERLRIVRNPLMLKYEQHNILTWFTTMLLYFDNKLSWQIEDHSTAYHHVNHLAALLVNWFIKNFISFQNKTSALTTKERLEASSD